MPHNKHKNRSYIANKQTNKQEPVSQLRNKTYNALLLPPNGSQPPPPPHPLQTAPQRSPFLFSSPLFPTNTRPRRRRRRRSLTPPPPSSSIAFLLINLVPDASPADVVVHGASLLLLCQFLVEAEDAALLVRAVHVPGPAAAGAVVGHVVGLL